MARKTDHVKLRDGSAGLGGPRPRVAPRPAKRPAEAETGTKEFAGAYSDPSRRTVGVYDARRQFEGAHGNPSPRQKAMRGENVVPKSATEGPFPAPLD
jgi:hypothetical protein